MPRMNLLAAVLLIASVGLDSAAAQTAKVRTDCGAHTNPSCSPGRCGVRRLN